jgi:hypothetical protein
LEVVLGQIIKALWDQVVKLHSRPFRHQEGGELCFLGTIQTDGVGVKILKKKEEARKQVTVQGLQFKLKIQGASMNLLPGSTKKLQVNVSLSTPDDVICYFVCKRILLLNIQSSIDTPNLAKVSTAKQRTIAAYFDESNHKL